MLHILESVGIQSVGYYDRVEGASFRMSGDHRWCYARIQLEFPENEVRDDSQ